MAQYPLVHCERDNPNVCTVCFAKENDAVYLAVEGTTVCSRHGANGQLESLRKKSANQYRLQVWQKRTEEFTESEYAKSLRGEIGILKMVLEQIVCQCENPHQLLLYSPKIADLISKIEKTVMSCDRLEKNMGMMLDKSTAMKLAADIVDLISTHVTDAVTVDNISNGIIDLLKEL